MRTRSDGRWQWVRPRVDLRHLPVTVDLSPARNLVWPGIGLGAILFAVAAQHLLRHPPQNLAMLVMMLPFPGAGLAIAAWCGIRAFERRIVTFARDGVSVEERTLLGRRAWRLPYDAFEGVVYKRRSGKTRRNPVLYQVIELAHRDPGRSIPLYVKVGEKRPIKLWQAYAEALGLPAIEDRNSPDKPDAVLFSYGRRPLRSPFADG
ncbi:MAG TPA: hypothetical protein VFZ01_09115 [Geminicoccaceae bacterium]